MPQAPSSRDHPPTGLTLPTCKSAELLATPKGGMLGKISWGMALRASQNCQ